jgi:hypothetical protein
MPWTPPPSPGWLDRLNAHAAAVGGAEHLVSLEPDEIIATARASTGLDDFGGVAWRPHFDVLVDALRAEADLTVAGRILARTDLLRTLRQRLLLARRWEEDPTILDERIDQPVFVVGTGRSGTSILHELLALDPASRTPATWELIFPADAVGDDAHAATARRVGHQVHAFWGDLQPAYESMHHNDGDEPNECIFLTMLEFLSDQWGGTYDVPSYSTYLVRADHTEAYRYHRKVLQTLQHHTPAATRWVLKAPSHLSQLRTLFAVYPDARVIQLHRDPLKTVPSTISLMGTIKSMRTDAVNVDAHAPWISIGYGMMLDATIDARAAGELPDGQFVDVRYADLMTDPAATVERIYERLALDPPVAFRDAVLAHVAARPKDARGPHRYSLADSRLDPVAERARFARYQAQYGVPDET